MGRQVPKVRGYVAAPILRPIFEWFDRAAVFRKDLESLDGGASWIIDLRKCLGCVQVCELNGWRGC